MKLKTFRNIAVAAFCTAAAAANLLYSEGHLPDIPESLEFFDVPAASNVYEDRLTDINSAELEELMLLPGIGEVRAKAIIEYRQTYGGFLSIEEITEVRGIGNVTYENIKDLITAGNT